MVRPGRRVVSRAWGPYPEPGDSGVVTIPEVYEVDFGLPWDMTVWLGLVEHAGRGQSGLYEFRLGARSSTV